MKKVGNEYRRPANLVIENVPPDEPQGGDKEIHIDALIDRSKTLLGTSLYNDIFSSRTNCYSWRY